MHVHKQVAIDATPAKLWPLLTEPEKLKTWIDNLVDDTPDGPQTTGVGARSTMKIREGKKIVSYQSVVTAWEPERRVAIRLSGGTFAKGMAMDVDYLVTPTATGSLLDYDVKVTLAGWCVVLAPLIWIVSRFNATSALDKLSAAARTA